MLNSVKMLLNTLGAAYSREINARAPVELVPAPM